jgi:hypothetical protein
MPDRRNQVRPTLVSKSDVSAAISVGWARAARKAGKGAFADALQVDAKTINRALTGETVPELHTALNSALVDPTALQEVMSLYGLELRPAKPEAANDLDTLAKVSHLAGKWAEALADGRRDHRETCDLADAIRPLLVALSAVVAEAERIKAA